VKKIVLVVAPKDYRDEEYEETKQALEEAGVSVYVASTDVTEAMGLKSGRAPVDFLLRNVSPNDFQGIVFIGGPGSKNYVGHDVAENLIRKFMSQGKVIGAICYAPAILAKAGLLSGKRATGWKTEDNEEVPDMIIRGGGTYVEEPIVVEDNIVTAFNHQSAKEFGKTLARML
jgi:protease I